MLFEQLFLLLYHLLLKLIFVYFSLLKTHIVSNFSMYPLYSTCVNNRPLKPMGCKFKEIEQKE